MSLNEMLPFLEGWEYYYIDEEKTVDKTKDVNAYSKTVKGWLYSIDMVCDDAYSRLTITYLGTTHKFTPHLLFTMGAVMPPPFGLYLSEYIRPSILSTAGAYVLTVLTSAYPFSTRGLATLLFGLAQESTQASSTIRVLFIAIRVTNDEDFIRSVRKFRYGRLAPLFEVLGHIPVLKFLGVPNEIKKVFS